jgi:hypothetical protein
MTELIPEMAKFTPLTKAQKRKFYREAVRETLVAIYGRSESDSRSLVAAWWKRATESGALQSEIFFHAEPLHVAADISHSRSIEITAQNEKAYENVLSRAREWAFAKTKSPVVISEALKAGLTHANVSVKKPYSRQQAAKQVAMRRAAAAGS